ncbi:MAG: zinc ribbon domain-containing protein, partial [Acidobacteriota bacterium]
MPNACQNCQEPLAEDAAFCESCGHLATTLPFLQPISSLNLTLRMEQLKAGFQYDPVRFHLLLSLLSGLLVVIIFSPSPLGKESGSAFAALGSFFGQAFLAAAVAYFPVGRCLHREWPLFTALDQQLGD